MAQAQLRRLNSFERVRLRVSRDPQLTIQASGETQSDASVVDGPKSQKLGTLIRNNLFGSHH